MSSFIASNTLFITLASTGAVIWIIALFVQRHQPKERNKIYGYRTIRSMRSQEAWDFAQEYSTDLLLKAAHGLCVISIFSLMVKIGPETGAILGTIIIILAILVPFYYTERELKRRFE